METVILNGLNLTTNLYHITDVKFDISSERKNYSYVIPRADRAKLVSSELSIKKIMVIGYIIASSRKELLNKIDILKQSIYSENMILSITYGDTTRQYYVDFSKADFNEMSVTYSTFQIELIVNEPAGYSVNMETKTYNGKTSNINEIINFLGTFRPEPIISILINSETELTQIDIIGGEQTLTIEKEFKTDDLLLINTKLKKVLLNGTEIDYTGGFPNFTTGENNLKIEFTATAFNVDVDVSYIPRWI